MNIALQDLVGFLVGAVIAPLFMLLPGFGLVSIAERCGIVVAQGWRRVGWALLLSISVLPIAYALAVRFCGMGALALTALAISLPGLARLPGPRRVRWSGLYLAALIWGLAVLAAYIDVEYRGSLHQSLLIIDLVKHAAVIESILRDGLPLSDPFFFRRSAAGYYFYFYLWPAAVSWLSGGFVDARMAFAATVFWTGPALVALLWHVGNDAGLIRPGGERRFLTTITILCFVSGADLPFMIARALGGPLEAQVDWWSEEIRFAFGSLLWVPHHIAAVIACWTGFLLIVRRVPATVVGRAVTIALSGLIFASVFGLSAWIALTAAAVLAVWAFWRSIKRDWQPVLLLSAIAIVALIVSLPQITDLLSGRAAQQFPVALAIRGSAGMTAHGPWQSLAAFLVLPLSYCIEFGVFAFTAFLFFRAYPIGSPPLRPLMVIAAAVSLIVASILKSSIIFNDLGWRAPWFAQVPAMVWAATMLQWFHRLRQARSTFVALTAIGIASNVWDLVGLRIGVPLGASPQFAYVNADPALDAELRGVYRWAATTLPANAVLQENPARTPRVFDFGLYGRQRIGVADAQAMLFGASRIAVQRRIEAVAPIFLSTLPINAIDNRAQQAGIDALIFTDRDAAWRRFETPVERARCRYKSKRTCVVVLREDH